MYIRTYIFTHIFIWGYLLGLQYQRQDSSQLFSLAWRIYSSSCLVQGVGNLKTTGTSNVAPVYVWSPGSSLQSYWCESCWWRPRNTSLMFTGDSLSKIFTHSSPMKFFKCSMTSPFCFCLHSTQEASQLEWCHCHLQSKYIYLFLLCLLTYLLSIISGNTPQRLPEICFTNLLGIS